jgi:hypothetical protein
MQRERFSVIEHVILLDNISVSSVAPAQFRVFSYALTREAHPQIHDLST